MVDFSRHSPLDGSAAVATVSGEIGTAGCFVRVGSEAVCILGSAHVLAAGSSRPDDSRIFQPPAGHTGFVQVAQLWDAYAPDRTDQSVNLLDAAIAVLLGGIDFSPVISGLGAPTGINTNLRVNERVQIHGAGSGEQTSGLVINLSDSTTVNYSDGSSAQFQELVKCENYSTPGDSGAAVLDTNGYLVGIHLCGTDSYSWFCPIQAALKRWPTLSLVS